MQPRKSRRTKNVSSSESRDIFDEHAMFTCRKPGASSGNGHLFAPLRDVVVRAPAPEETKVFSPWLPLKTWWQPRWPLGRTIARLGHGDAAHRWPLRESPFDLLLPKTTRGLKKSHRFSSFASILPDVAPTRDFRLLGLPWTSKLFSVITISQECGHYMHLFSCTLHFE